MTYRIKCARHKELTQRRIRARQARIDAIIGGAINENWAAQRRIWEAMQAMPLIGPKVTVAERQQ